MVIDAHQHFWRYDSAEFEWIPDEWAAIRRDFLPEQLREIMASHGVDGVVSVQARQSIEETRWLLELADRHPFVRGVVGWLPLASPTLQEALDEVAAHPRFVGARHVLQAENEGYFADLAFNRGLQALAGRGLVYDLLVAERQLSAAITVVDRHPSLAFVLDHLAKPDLRHGAESSWESNLRELARREHVTCKISGGITEADPRWTAATIIPFLDAALAAFGPRRLMFGSNWPVSEATGGSTAWMELVREWARRLTAIEQAYLFGRTASDVYGL